MPADPGLKPALSVAEGPLATIVSRSVARRLLIIQNESSLPSQTQVGGSTGVGWRKTRSFSAEKNHHEAWVEHAPAC